MTNPNRVARFWPHAEFAPASFSLASQPESAKADGELPAPWIDRGPDYSPGGADPLDLFDKPEFDVVLACDMNSNYGANGTLTVRLKTGECFDCYSARLWHWGWLVITGARWLNGPLHLREVEQDVLVYHDNIATAKWNWPEGLLVEDGR